MLEDAALLVLVYDCMSEEREGLPGAETVYTPVEPAALHEDHWSQSEDESELYEVTAVGVAEQADWMQLDTEAPWLAAQ
jgi:hypothetical protein